MGEQKQIHNLPKHIPHKPCRMVRIMTKFISPLHSTWNTTIINMSTSAVWPHITTNWVITCENNTSNGVTPEKIKSCSIYFVQIIFFFNQFSTFYTYQLPSFCREVLLSVRQLMQTMLMPQPRRKLSYWKK